MHDAPSQKLCELIIEYGRSLCDDPRRCEALPKDYCGQHKREIFVLISALKNRVAEDLLKAPAGIPQSMVLARLNKRLEDELAMTPEAAHWAVESWALALGFISQPSPVVKPVLVPASPPATPPPVPKVVPTPQARPAGTLMAGRYRDNGDGTVTDVQTGLQWIRFSLGQEWKGGNCVGKTRAYTWQEALDANEALNRQGGYAGDSDWRVPTKEELQSLVDLSRCPIRIHPTAFPNASDGWYWSSSVYTINPGYAWYVDFHKGSAVVCVKANLYRVRLVRG